MAFKMTIIKKDSKKKQRQSVSFDERLIQCKEFFKKNGHCKIPTNYKEDKSLGIWVQEIRRNFKMLTNGLKPRKSLSREQMEILNGIKFYWGVPFDLNKVPESDASWEKNFAAAKQYKESHGNFDVPIEGELAALGKWIRVQRAQKKKRDGKVKCLITKDRIKMLNGIGFDWKGPHKVEK